MSKEIRLCGGPGDGRIWTVRNVNDVFYFASVERIDATRLDDVAMQTAPLTRRSAYRCRRIASTGHPVHNAAQQVLFDWIGDA